MKTYFFLFTLLAFSACNQNDTPEASTANSPANIPGSSGDLNTYLITEIPGSKLRRAEKKDAGGNLIEQGLLFNGKRNGTWITFYNYPNYPNVMASFIDDKYNGPYLEFDRNQQITLKAYYEDNLLEGYWARYQFGQLTFEATYQKGKLNGIYKEYRADGKVSKEISYKEGQLDGPYRFYDDAGNVVLEYQYRKGEKR